MGASELLRMLEPAVRPIGGSAPIRTVQPSQQPIEHQSFEALLAQVQETGTAEETMATQEINVTDVKKSATSMPPLADLAAFDRIENASLRNLFSRS